MNLTTRRKEEALLADGRTLLRVIAMAVCVGGFLRCQIRCFVMADRLAACSSV